MDAVADAPGPGLPDGVSGRTARELVDSVEAAVLSGRLLPGTLLPSVRSIADEVGVSHTTVAGAMAELRRRGLVVTHERRRARVAAVPALAMTMAPPPVPAGVRDVRHGGPDARLLPDLRAAVRKAADEIAVPRLYGLPQIDEELESIATARFSKGAIDPAHITVCGGALDAIQRALETSLRPGDAIAVEDPGYADLFDLARSLGLRLLPVSADSEGLLPDGLERALREARAVVVTPVGQNPLGAATTPGRASELNALLRDSPSTLVIEDQHLGAIAAEPVTLTQGLGRWLVVRTLAKAYGPDLRVALVAGDAFTIARVRGRIAMGPGWTSHLLQRTAVHLLKDRALSRRLAAARKTYDRRREAFRSALTDRGVAAEGASGLNLWIEVPDEGEVLSSLMSSGWAAAPGALFRLATPPAVRITTSTLEERDALALAGAVAAALEMRLVRQV